MIVCTGPISSGTRLMAGIVRDDWGLDAVHRSMPHWETWWDWRDFPADTRFVIIVRRPDFSVQSAYRSGHGNPGLHGWKHRKHRAEKRELMEWWWKAIGLLAGFPRAWWLSYEALVAEPRQQLENLAGWLGVKPVLKRKIHDANERWR